MNAVNPSYKRILIIKPSSLGDIIHALPTLAALRDAFPESWIAWLVKREWAEILEGHPDLNEVLSVDFRPRGWASLVRVIRGRTFDLTVDLQGLFRTGFLSRLSGARERVGFADGREGSPFFYTQKVKLPIPIAKPWRLLDMHAVDRNLQIAKHLGAEIGKPRFPFPSFEKEQDEVEGWLHHAGVNPTDRLIALAPLARLEIKNWPFEKFLQVAGALCARECTRIVLIGTESQRWMGAPFQRRVGQRLVNLVGKTRVRQLPALLKRVHLLIANDSAPLHLASVSGTPVIALLGPTNHLATGPYGDGLHCIVRTSLPCSPCGRQACHNQEYLECLNALSVDQVVGAANSLLMKAGFLQSGVEV